MMVTEMLMVMLMALRVFDMSSSSSVSLCVCSSVCSRLDVVGWTGCVAHSSVTRIGYSENNHVILYHIILVK